MAASHIELPIWLGVSPDALKSELVERRVNSCGWRLYLETGDALFSPLRRQWLDPHSNDNRGLFAVIWLRLIQSCEMDVPPPLALSASISDWHLPGHGFGHIPPLFLRAAWKATAAAEYAGKDMAAFVTTEVVPLAQWFFDSGAFRTMAPGQLKAGWETLQRLYLDALLEVRATAIDWPPFLLKIEPAGLRFMALTSDAALELEGRAMVHCIGDYGDRGRYGMLRAWSVLEKKSGNRVATLTAIERNRGHWVLDNLKGRYNAPVPERVNQAAMNVVWALQDAYSLVPSIRLEMDRARVVRRLPSAEHNQELDGITYDEYPF